VRVPAIPEFFQPLVPWAKIALPLAAPMLILGYLVRRKHEQLFGPVRQRAVPWGGPEVLLAFLILMFLPLVFYHVFRDSGLFNWMYGPNALKDELGRTRAACLATLATLPLQVPMILWALHEISDVRPYQLGFTPYRAGAYVLAGYLYWLFLMPGVTLLNVLTTWLYHDWFGSEPDKHGLQRLMENLPTLSDWVLIVLSALLVAPLMEEFIYRGVVQQWVIRRAYRGDIILGLTLVQALFHRESGLEDAVRQRDWSLLAWELQPALFVLATVPVYLFVRLRQRSAAVGGIFAVALFFVMAHSAVWPSPIPLLPLGLTLGYLAYRTQSLIPPILVHVLFNAVALVGPVHPKVPKPANGSAVTVPARFDPSTSTSSFVPGVSCPRRM
jgi:membrane protease YdiL (CAAX protease family)